MSIERLSWLEECLKFYFVQLIPETLVHRAPSTSPAVVILLSGDALFSMGEEDSRQLWSIILSMGGVSVVCDRKELDLRGISVEPLVMKFPGQVIDTNSLAGDNQPSFWKDVIGLVRQIRPSLPDTVGWLQSDSPYMHSSAAYGIRFLSAGTEARLSVELYAYLDGVHMGHAGQNPQDSENIVKGLEELHDRAAKQGLTSQFIACSSCAGARGYSTWDDGKGHIISNCAIKPFHIREMNVLVEQFSHPHVILSGDAGAVQLPRKGQMVSFDREKAASSSPPVTILVTHPPYSTEHVYGAVAFAAACAHKGILTRVVFLEDGVYTVTGNHRTARESQSFTLPEIINAVAGNENLHFFVLTPSLQKRGITKNRNLNAVLDIGYPGLGKILFYPPGNVQAEHQRIFLF